MSKYAGKIVTNQAAAGYSVYFDGTGDYLTAPSSTAFNFGTGDFTVEAWINPSTVSGTKAIIGIFESIVGGWYFGMNGASLRFSSGFADYDAGTLVLGAWSHVAATVSGSNLRMFINGVQVNTTTNVSGQNFNITNSLWVGNINTAGWTFTGYISNVRIVKGTALYTAAFTPPTQLLNVTNTSLLTCNSPAIVDQSSNAFAITTTGTPTVSTFTPFTAYVPYNPALGAATPGVWSLDEAMQAAATRQWNMYDPSFQNTTLLLHGNGTNGAQNNTFLDSSTNNFTITRNGNTTQGSFSPFSQAPGWWSNYFDGVDDTLISSGTPMNFGTGNFTFEMWVYPLPVGSFKVIVNTNTTGGVGGGVNSNGTITVGRALVGTDGTTSNAVTFNAWNHIAWVRNSGTVKIYINGVEGFSGSLTYNYPSGALRLGSDNNNTLYYPGYISNVRVSTTAVYTSGFTPSTSPLTTSTSPTILTAQSNRFLDNSGNGLTFTIQGSPEVTPFSPFPITAAYTPATIGGSGYFDGTGDYLTNASLSPSLSLGTSDWCIECWGYWTSFNFGTYGSPIISFGGANSQLMIRANKTSASSTSANYYSVNNNNFIPSAGYSSGVSAGTIYLNSWTHIALTRSGSTFRLFINGSLVSTQTDAASFSTAYTTLTIGADTDPNSGRLAGYTTGVRVVTGNAVYTAAFTPPTAPPTAISGTYLLTNFTNAGIVDSTAKNVLETVGNAQISTTQSKFGGSSMYFDGTGDYLVPRGLLDLGSGNFTVEFWLYPNSSVSGTYAGILDSRTSGNGAGLVYVGYTTTANQIGWYDNTTFITTGTVTLSAWNHVAFVRSGSTLTMYVGGSSTATATYTQALSVPFRLIGTSWDNFALNGYLDDLRITKGIARYTGNFTPQTSQWQDQ